MASSSPQPFDDYVARMRLADATSLTEVAIRLGVVSLCALAAFFVLQDGRLIGWTVLYITATFGYVAWLRLQGPGITPLFYWLLLGLHVSIGFWFALMPVYIATLGNVMALFIGYSAVAGLAMHNLTRRSMTLHVAWSDTGVVVVAGLFVCWQFVRAMPEQHMGLVIAVVGVGLLGYYVHTFIDTIRMRSRLEHQAAREQQAQKMRAVGQLTAGISHDFNNILTVIRGNLDLHDALEDGPERDQVLREAKDASEKAAHLVAQLLAFSRKSRIDPQPQPVAQTLDSFVALARRTLPATIALEICHPLPEINIVADQTLLQNALLNAAVNARDAMGAAGGSIRVRVDLTEAPCWPGAAHLPHRLYACLVLSDTGPGVPPPLLEKLTEPFFTSKPVGQGSGLGLSMIKGFAEQSGGYLHLENGAEGGLRLNLLLPAETT